MILLQIFIFFLGGYLVIIALSSAIKSLVLPRSAPDQLTRLVFLLIRRLFLLRIRRVTLYHEKDRIMAFFAPISLLTLVPVWLALVLAGYAGMLWATGNETIFQAFQLSGSSLLTLGFAITDNPWQTILVFSEALIGLILIALLIAYLPTMYSAFSRREAAVTLLEVRAGQPPSAVEIILRYHRIQGFGQLTELWRTWEAWFAEVEESHTSHPALCFFRSPQPHHSWVTAAGAVLDAASLILSTVDVLYDPAAALCIRTGFLAFRHIVNYFDIPYNPSPFFPDIPISISRQEYDEACEQLSSNGVPLKPDRDQGWMDFAGWRVNYDSNLLALAAMTMAPEAPWSSDRAPKDIILPLLNKARSFS
jgi:hypothetical protein